MLTSTFKIKATSSADAEGDNTLESIEAEARRLGFDAFGVSSVDIPSHKRESLDQFIQEGRHGDMDWMERRKKQRASPSILWPEVRSIIVLGMSYAPNDDPLEGLEFYNRGIIASYAKGRDYHDVIKKRLKSLARWIVAEYSVEVKVFVDTAPVMEKPLAERAGIGWQGRHTNLVSREFGSWLFLGEIFTTLVLPHSKPIEDSCGRCVSCVDSCPTGAIEKSGKIDARKCISYLTIEHKGHISSKYRVAMANRIYGCDDCLAVCPWNKFSGITTEDAFIPRPETLLPCISDLLKYDDKSFRKTFSGSPIKRIGRNRFIRNVLIAAGNSGDNDLIDLVTDLLRDDSSLVRAMSVWALGRLDLDKAIKIRAKMLPNEKDSQVIEEWVSLEREKI